MSEKKDQVSYSAEIKINISLEGGTIETLIVTASDLEVLHNELSAWSRK